jgi:Protein of unknown function (DUF2510)
MSNPQTPAGWQPDPTGRYQYRYWDGAAWSDHVSTQGSQQRDPMGAQLTPSFEPAGAPISGPPASTMPPAASPQRPSSTAVKCLIFGGAVVLAVGSLLPWVKASAGIFSVTKNGTDGDGVITIVIAGLVALLYLVIKQRPATEWVALSLGGVAAAVAIYDIVDVSNRAHDLSASNSAVSASVGIGLIIAAVGAVAIIIGGIIGIKEPR